MKKLLFLFALIGILTLISGCNGVDGGSSKNSASTNDRDMRRPDFGQPKEKSDIGGLVESIVGNEVTILKIERPEFNKEENAGAVQEGNNSKDDTKVLSMGGATGTRMPGMRGSTGGGFNGGERNEDMQAQMLERMKELASGEEKVLIPIGIQMLKPDAENSNREPAMIEATLADIKANSMLQIWLDKSVDDRNVAKFVLIRN